MSDHCVHIPPCCPHVPTLQLVTFPPVNGNQDWFYLSAARCPEHSAGSELEDHHRVFLRRHRGRLSATGRKKTGRLPVKRRALSLILHTRRTPAGVFIGPCGFAASDRFTFLNQEAFSLVVAKDVNWMSRKCGGTVISSGHSRHCSQWGTKSIFPIDSNTKTNTRNHLLQVMDF